MPASRPLYVKARELYKTLYNQLRRVQMTDTLMPDDYNVPYQIMKALLEAVNRPIPIPHREIKMGDKVWGQHVLDLRTICYELWMYMYQILQEPYIYDNDFFRLKDILDQMPIPRHGSMISPNEWNAISDFCRGMIDLILKYYPHLWPMLHRDARRTSRAVTHNVIYVADDSGYLYAINPDGSLKWKVYVPEEPLSTLGNLTVGDDGTIYIADYDGYLYAINPDGSLKWKVEIRLRTPTPVIGEDGTIYLAGGGRLQARNPDGSLKWSSNIAGYEPIIADDGSIVMCDGYGRLYCINPDGSLRWKREDLGQTYTIVAAHGNVVYVSSDDEGVYAIYLDSGEVKWFHEIKVKLFNEIRGSMCGCVTVGDDGTVYFPERYYYFDENVEKDRLDAYLRAINKDGKLKWRRYLFHVYYEDGEIPYWGDPRPAVSYDGTIYVNFEIDYHLHAINPDGSLKWSLFLDVDSLPYLAVAPCGTIYACFSGRYPIGGPLIPGRLYAINPNGSIKWIFNLDRGTWCAPVIA